MAGVCTSVRLSFCRVLQPNSRMEMPRKPKIGKMEATYNVQPLNLVFRIQKVKGQGHQAD